MYSWQNHKLNKRKHICWALAGLTLLFGFLLPNSLALAAEQVTVTIPTFDVTLNGRTMDGTYSKYPLIVYKDITYFPMTYYDSRLLGVQADWSKETGLVVTKKNGYCYEYMREINEEKNKSHLTAQITEGKITVNGKVIDNSKEKYPLLHFRDVTYFPLTWHFAVKEFGWDYKFKLKKGLVITTPEVTQAYPNEGNWEIGGVSGGGAGSKQAVEGVDFPIRFISKQKQLSLSDKEQIKQELGRFALLLYNYSYGKDTIIQPDEHWEYQLYRLLDDRQELLYWRKVPFYVGKLPKNTVVFSGYFDVPFWNSDTIQEGQYLIQMQHPDNLLCQNMETHEIEKIPIQEGLQDDNFIRLNSWWNFYLSSSVTITK